jgi:hypothetical protein
LGFCVVEDPLSERAFDAITRRAADAVSRRNSILALGGAALAAAVMTEPVTAKQKAKKQAKKKCRRQVAPCRSFLAGLCGGIQECLDEMLPCCDHLAQCDSSAMFICMFSCGCGDNLPEHPDVPRD